MIPFQLHRRIPFIRRLFWQRDLARQEVQELRERAAEHDALIAQPETQIAELEEKSRTSEAFDWVNPPDRVSWLQVETTTLCSLKCAGCGRTIAKAVGTWTDQHMSAARFRKIIEHAPP